MQVEVFDLGGGEGFAEHGHALFPFLLADHGQFADVFEVLEVELDVCRADPTLKK